MTDITVSWRRERRDQFASEWPCCDIPPSGWATFEANGDLVDLCNNTRYCEAGGGLSAFLDDSLTEARDNGS